jgi:hypothetical protein
LTLKKAKGAWSALNSTFAAFSMTKITFQELAHRLPFMFQVKHVSILARHRWRALPLV